ncbi:11882_t:CDS:1 [Acaulospora morrowiae]|uniref:11882_t:CDS:1 n=1 Tax=Acaulospora morrowiae TaxID=94023 RepID=A0A9N9B2U7_9GLOM|nr:11882_t:CDS:1 [Acaulospora morrowiae]
MGAVGSKIFLSEVLNFIKKKILGDEFTVGFNLIATRYFPSLIDLDKLLGGNFKKACFALFAASYFYTIPFMLFLGVFGLVVDIYYRNSESSRGERYRQTGCFLSETEVDAAIAEALKYVLGARKYVTEKIFSFINWLEGS